MKSMLMRVIMIFLVFLISACSLLLLDNICVETTGEGGKLIFDVANLDFFH